MRDAGGLRGDIIALEAFCQNVTSFCNLTTEKRKKDVYFLNGT